MRLGSAGRTSIARRPVMGGGSVITHTGCRSGRAGTAGGRAALLRLGSRVLSPAQNIDAENNE